MNDDIVSLFSPSSLGSEMDSGAWTAIHSALEGLLSQDRVSSGGELALVMDQFQDTLTPCKPVSLQSYLENLAGSVLPHAVNVASPRCIGSMASVVPHFMSALAAIVAALNQNMVTFDASRVVTLLERQTLARIHRLVYDLPGSFYDLHSQDRASTLGIMTSNATLANLTALWIARNSCFPSGEDFPGVEQVGLQDALEHFGYRDTVVIGSRLMHYSFDKAANLLGVGGKRCIKLEADGHGRIDLGQLERALDECARRRRRVIAVVGVAGSTDSGSIDPLGQMADVAARWGVHFHIDAAWGAPLLFSQRHSGKLSGINRGTSVTVDGHKQFYVPIGASVLLLRDPLLAGVVEQEAEYMLRKGSGDLGGRSVEGSRPAAALLFHAALNLIGRSGYEQLVNANLAKAAFMAQSVDRRAEFQLLGIPETNIVLYRYLPGRFRDLVATMDVGLEQTRVLNACNEGIQKLQCHSGSSFVSRTLVETNDDCGRRGTVALRAVLSNPLTTEQDIEDVLDEQVGIGDQLDRHERPMATADGRQEPWS